MRTRNFLKPFAATLAGGVLLCLAGHAHALTMIYTAAPSCTGTGSCTATLNDPNPFPGLSSGFTVEVDLDFPFHIELFDRQGTGDPLSEAVQLAMEVTNPEDITVILEMEFRFTDEFGQVIQDQGQDLVLTNTIGFAPLVGFTPTLNFPGDFPLDEIIFHDFIFTANVTTPNANLEFGPLTEVRFLGFDADSNVGLWPDDDIPTPGTLALMGVGLIGLGLLHRRRRRLN